MHFKIKGIRKVNKRSDRGIFSGLNLQKYYKLTEIINSLSISYYSFHLINQSPEMDIETPASTTPAQPMRNLKIKTLTGSLYELTVSADVSHNLFDMQTLFFKEEYTQAKINQIRKCYFQIILD